MSLFKNNEDLLDEAIAQVANEPIEPAAGRGGGGPRLGPPASRGSPGSRRWPQPSPAAGSLHGCEDFQSLIPAYLRGELLHGARAARRGPYAELRALPPGPPRGPRGSSPGGGARGRRPRSLAPRPPGVAAASPPCWWRRSASALVS